MVLQNGHRLKVEKSSQTLTSFAGLPLLTELAHHSKLIRDLDNISGLWERHGRFQTSDYVMGLASTLIAGGERLDDMRLLREDPGLKQLAFPLLPASNSLGDFLRRFTHRTLWCLAQVNARVACRVLALGHWPKITLDMDSSLVEAHKEQAHKTYQGFPGYNPLLAWLAEPNVFLAGLFRPGNASPQSHILSLLRSCARWLPQGIELRLRTDSAAYQIKIFQYCVDHGIEFTIGADLDCSVREVIENIPDNKWQLVVRGEDTFLLAETVHAPGQVKQRQKLPAFRLIVTRKLSGQLELFKDPLKHRAIISNLPAAMNTEQVLDFHNARGSAEKAIGELKNGFGLEHPPCGQLMANAAFLQVGLVAYNLVQMFKHCALPQGWKRFSIKNLRFRLLCQAARITSHARRIVLKLSQDFPFFDVFEQARWAVLAPQVALSG